MTQKVKKKAGAISCPAPIRKSLVFNAVLNLLGLGLFKTSTVSPNKGTTNNQLFLQASTEVLRHREQFISVATKLGQFPANKKKEKKNLF